jgi:hypothetical protein
VTTTMSITPRDGGWQEGNQVWLGHLHVDSGDGLTHTGVSLDYGDGREPVTIVVTSGIADYDIGFGVGFSSPDPAPGVTYHVSVSGGELPNNVSEDLVLPAYPAPAGNFTAMIGRADVAACMPEDGPRGLGFRG